MATSLTDTGFSGPNPADWFSTFWQIQSHGTTCDAHLGRRDVLL